MNDADTHIELNRSGLPASLANRPYSDRQFIVVAADEVVEAEQVARSKAATRKATIDWITIADSTLTVVAGGGQLFAVALIEAVKAWNRLRAGGMPIMTIKRSEAANLVFTPGHPRDGFLYVGHPAVPQVYYTPALFHRHCFEHKFCEALRLLTGLGSAKISIEHVSGWSKKFLAGLSVPHGHGGTVSAKTGGKSKSASRLLFTANYGGDHEPAIPPNLVWYPHESLWQEIAYERLHHGLTDFSLTVRYEEDFGVDAKFAGTVLKSKLSLGGDFESHKATVWRLVGRFRPMPHKKPRD